MTREEILKRYGVPEPPMIIEYITASEEQKEEWDNTFKAKPLTNFQARFILWVRNRMWSGGLFRGNTLRNTAMYFQARYPDHCIGKSSVNRYWEEADFVTTQLDGISLIEQANEILGIPKGKLDFRI